MGLKGRTHAPNSHAVQRQFIRAAIALSLVGETVWGNVQGGIKMRIVVMVAVVGLSLAAASAASTAPYNAQMQAIGDVGATTDNVRKVQHWRWGSDGHRRWGSGGHWRWGSGGHWRWGSHRRHCKHRWWDSRWRCYSW